MKKNILIIVGVVLLAALAGAGGFWGGMAYQVNQDSQAQARFFEQRGDSSLMGRCQVPEKYPKECRLQTEVYSKVASEVAGQWAK